MRRLFLLVILLLAPVVLAGCFNLAKYDKAVIEKNQELSDKAKEKVEQGLEAGKDKLKDYTKEQLAKIAASLTDSAKQAIDKWLVDNGLNKYGDLKGTMYAGGTPLFDEATGQVQDKYEYILENHPELIEDLGLDKK